MPHNFSQSELEFIQVSSKECRTYKVNSDRIYPFQPEIIWSNIINKTYSDFLKAPICNIEQACNHASYTIEKWIHEDKAALKKAQNQRYNKKKKQTLIETNPELALAKVNWQTAIAQRKAALEEWDRYVTHLQHLYLQLKLRKIHNV